MTGAVKTSAAVTAKPAPASAAAIEARVRDVALVTKASGSPASHNRRSAATAPSSDFHDTVTTPSMSIDQHRANAGHAVTITAATAQAQGAWPP
jgi:hypothetical protein